MRALLAAFLLPLLLATPALAVEPDEMLDDPVLEARARALSEGLRCLVCRNESIDESNAELARELRILVRERIAAGDSDEEVIDYLVGRYGEYVLLRPRADGINRVLWLAPPVMLLGALGVAVLALRRRRRGAPEAGLSEEEAARLRELLED